MLTSKHGQTQGDSTGVLAPNSPGTVSFSPEQTPSSIVKAVSRINLSNLSKPRVGAASFPPFISGPSAPATTVQPPTPACPLPSSEAVLPSPSSQWSEAHSQYSPLVAQYLWHGPASNSWKTNNIGQKSFIDFVRLQSAYLNEEKSILPATPLAILEWIASLGARNVQPKTIKSYLIDVRSLHVDAGYPFTVCESPVVQRLIRGIKHVHGERARNPKFPITIDVLRRLCVVFRCNSLHDVIRKAVVTVAFSAFLRCSEFTVETDIFYDPATHLSRGCVQFLPNASSPTHLLLSLPASKTDPFRKGAAILVAAAPGTPTCPVAALKALFDCDPRPPSSPLFCGFESDQPLNRDSFVFLLQSILSCLGFDNAKHWGCSFRRGAASAAAAVGYSEYEIQLLGRWRSDADKLYSEVPRDRILQLSARLHSAEPPAQSSVPLAHPSAPSLA